jgi:hypothetical protein
MSAFDEAARRQLRRSIASNGVPADQAAVIVDLACQAADRAQEAFTTVITAAGDGLTGLAAMEIGSQLSASLMRNIFERTHEYGKSMGLPITSAEITLGASS